MSEKQTIVSGKIVAWRESKKVASVIVLRVHSIQQNCNL